MGYTPPKLIERCLESLGADTDFRDAVIGDLAEEFALRATWDGRDAAWRWYCRESLRVAPFLLRDWFRDLRAGSAARLAVAVSVSSGCVAGVESILQFGVRSLDRFAGTSLDAIARATGFGEVALSGFMLLWTVVDAIVGGYVAARLNRRAPLPSALVLGSVWTALMVLSGGHSIHVWFPFANVVAMMTGSIGGAMLAAYRVTEVAKPTH